MNFKVNATDRIKIYGNNGSGTQFTGRVLINGATGGFDYNNVAHTLEYLVNGSVHSELNQSAYVPAGGAKYLGAHTARWALLFTDGIRFGGKNTVAQTLDDYEEGSCSITLYVTGTSTTNTATNTVAYYTKIGNTVNVSYYSALLSVTNSGNAEINGLPFVSKNVNNHYPVAVFTHTNAFTTDIQNGYMSTNSTNLYPMQRNSTTPAVWNTSAGARYLMFTITYQTD